MFASTNAFPGHSRSATNLIAVALVVCLGSFVSLGRASSAETTKVIRVGNHFISRVFQADAKQAFTIVLRAKSHIEVTSAEFEVVCRTGSREVVFNRYNTSPSGFTVTPSGEEAVLRWTAEAPALEIKVHYEAAPEQPYIFKWVEVTNRSPDRVRILRATVDALGWASGQEPLRGGTGQPVVLNNEYFFGIEHPAATNEARGKGIVLSHYPEVDVAPGATWQSKRAVLGAALPGESVEDAFQNYLLHLTGRPAKSEPIFNDWGAHDELGTLVKPQLTAQLTSELLDRLEGMKAESGVQFDYYVVDGFWFDPKGAFLTFKQPNWPQGFEPSLRRMLALRMKPGLWFDLGGSTLDLKNTPGWHGAEKPCLGDPELRDLFEKAIALHVRDHSLSLLKFDFADMFCRRDGAEAHSLAVLEKNADGLREICDQARKSNPAMTILGFNSFSLGEMMGSTRHYDEAYAVSPWWLPWFDALYSGDPRPSELPSVTSLRDSVNAYQDHVFRGFVRSLMPPFMIDDAGTLVGKTSTNYYLGAEGFTDSWILNVMRGTHGPTLYGDARLLTANDQRFLAATLRLLRDNAAILCRTRPVLGIPGHGEVYGYLGQDEKLAFVTVVNPGLYLQSFGVPISGADFSKAFVKLVFSNDGEAKEAIAPFDGLIRGELIPGEIRVYAVGSRAMISAISLPPAPTRQYHQVTPVPDPFGGNKEADLRIAPSPAGKTLAIILQYFKNGEVDRSFDRSQEVMKVEGEVASAPMTFTSIPAAGTDIWSKCSWAVFKHKVEPGEAGKTVHLKLIGEPPTGTTWRITALWLQ